MDQALRCPSCGSPVPWEADRCPRCGADCRVIVLEQPAADRERPPRRSGVWRRRGLAAFGALMVGLALRLAGAGGSNPEATTEPGTPTPGSTSFAIPEARRPIDLTDGWICPPGWDFAAYLPSHHYYPPNHPLYPLPTARPAGCFQSAEEAEAEGYSAALPPNGTEIVGGVYVVPLDRGSMTSQCLRAANRLGFAVPCPLRLPSVPRHAPEPGCGLTSFGVRTRPPCVWDGAFLLDEGGIATPPGGDPLAEGELDVHLAITAYRTRDATLDPEARLLLECPSGSTQEGLTVPFLFMRSLEPATFVDCPAGPPPYGSSLILRWQRDGVVYELGYSEAAENPRRLLLAVAATLILVEPRA